MARMGRSRASALMKFTRTITIMKVERRIVRVVAGPGSPPEPREELHEVAPPAGGTTVPSDSVQPSEPEDNSRERVK